MWPKPLSWRWQHVLGRLLHALLRPRHPAPTKPAALGKVDTKGARSPCTAPLQHDHALGEVDRGQGWSVCGLALVAFLRGLLARRWQGRGSDDAGSATARSCVRQVTSVAKALGRRRSQTEVQVEDGVLKMDTRALFGTRPVLCRAPAANHQRSSPSDADARRCHPFFSCGDDPSLCRCQLTDLSVDSPRTML
jgi:hypothetical protein